MDCVTDDDYEPLFGNTSSRSLPTIPAGTLRSVLFQNPKYKIMAYRRAVRRITAVPHPSLQLRFLLIAHRWRCPSWAPRFLFPNNRLARLFFLPSISSQSPTPLLPSYHHFHHHGGGFVGENHTPPSVAGGRRRRSRSVPPGFQVLGQTL